MDIRSYGREAVLVELDSTTAATALRERLDRTPLPGTVETSPGLRTVLVRFDPTAVDAATVARRLTELDLSSGPESTEKPGESVTVRVAYDGPDLADVAAHAGMSPDDVVTAHTAATYRVALIGMAPGFYFLAGGDGRLQPPRRSSPRERVPRGSVGLAGPFTGIYPKVTPGGWQLVGHTVDDLWHADRWPAARLAPGATVRLVAA